MNLDNYLFSQEFSENIPVFTVSEFTRRLKRLLENHFPFVWIKGEISNLKVSSRGHMYFVLKDSWAQLNAVCFRDSRVKLRFEPQDGIEVVCFGRINVYEPRGEYQIIVEKMEPKGEGALRIAFDRLKRKLHSEGLFDESRKKPMPFCPQRIAVMTSAEGAAIQDVLKVLKKAPFATEITVIPVQVQGNAASFEIEEALKWVNSVQKHFKWDVLIVGRGGGSIEDLWAFNEERVARALAACVVPTISAVGHEIDNTISDYVSDLRAPTPTAAAEWIVNRQKEVLYRLTKIRDIIVNNMSRYLEFYEQKLDNLRHRLKDPRQWLDDALLFLDDKFSQMVKAFDGLVKDYFHRVEIFRMEILKGPGPGVISLKQSELESMAFRLDRAMKRILERNHELLGKYDTSLKMLNPFSVLNRGYSIVYRVKDGAILKDGGDVDVGDIVMIRPAKGCIKAIVEESFRDVRGGEGGSQKKQNL